MKRVRDMTREDWRALIEKHDDPPSCPHGVMAGRCYQCIPEENGNDDESDRGREGRMAGEGDEAGTEQRREREQREGRGGSAERDAGVLRPLPSGDRSAGDAKRVTELPPSTETLLDLTPVAPGKTVDDVLSARGEYGKAMAYKASKENAPLPTGATIRCPRCGTKSEIEFHYAGSLGGRLGMCVGPADRKQPCAACGSPPGEECRLRCSNEVLPKERNTNAAPAPDVAGLIARMKQNAKIAREGEWLGDAEDWEQAAAALESLARERDEARQDAERYRWLRSCESWNWSRPPMREVTIAYRNKASYAETDAAIDAAMRKK